MCNQCVPGPFLGALVATRLGSAGNVVQGIQFIANFIFKDTHLSEVILWLLQMVSVKILIKVVTRFLIQNFFEVVADDDIILIMFALVHPNYSKSEVETFIVKLVQFAESVFYYTEVKMPCFSYFTMYY